MNCQRIDIVGVPVDVVLPEDLEQVLFYYLEQAGTKQIVFLSVWKLLKATRNPDYLEFLKSATLILPTSKSICKAAAFLKKPVPARYNPFDAIIQMLTLLETRYKSLYLFGGHKGSLMNAERNIRATYPGLQVVGRYVGYYPKSMEKAVVSAIYKANPSLVLVSDGIRHGELWAYERRNQFGSNFFVYFKDAMDILSLRKKRLSKATFERGAEIWGEVVRNPLKIFLVFPYIRFKLRVLRWRLFKLKKETEALESGSLDL